MRPTRLAAVATVALLAGCGSSAGSAVLVDDTGLDDVDDGGGWVALVPADRVQDLWKAAGASPEDDLRHAVVPLTREAVESVGGVASAVSQDGDFDLGLTGGVLVCRVPEGSESTRGCVETDLAEGSELELVSGEGGLAVRD